jgi:hypothetical protein
VVLQQTSRICCGFITSSNQEKAPSDGSLFLIQIMVVESRLLTLPSLDPGSLMRTADARWMEQTTGPAGKIIPIREKFS